MMKRSFFLSTFLFAAVLSPIVLYGYTCAPPQEARLSVLELRVGDFHGENVIEGFAPEVFSYDAHFPEAESEAVLWVRTKHPSQSIEVEYDGMPVKLFGQSVAKLDVPLGHSELVIDVATRQPPSDSSAYRVQIHRGDLCEGVDCDDQNECTSDVCDPASGACEYVSVPDGSPCAEGKGGCYGGVCNFVPITVTVGDKELVFDWTTHRCEDFDVPDAPADFVRDENGELVLFDGNAPTAYVSRGADFDSLARVCHPPALVSADNWRPESYENWEWLWSVYREGPNWHALIHNEFHDAVSPNCKPGDPSPANLCWYNSITYAVSTDGGSTFTKPSPPAHVVAPAPAPWMPPATPVEGDYLLSGYFTPSAIVHGPDDYYYSIFGARPVQAQGGPGVGACAMRTKTLGDPTSWRAWDGTGFNLAFENPYEIGAVAQACAFLPTPEVSNVAGTSVNLTYNTYLERYMLVAQWVDASQPSDVRCGVYLSLSTDLIHWSQVQEIAPAHVLTCPIDQPIPGELESVLIFYASVVDHEDATVNFERPGRTPHLYYTRFNDDTQSSLDRDIVRVPLKLTLGGPLCEGVDCDDQNACTDDICNGADGSCEHTPRVCDDQNECTADDCTPAIGCEHTPVADGTPCAGGTCQAGVCPWYAQDFESLDQMSPTALSDDGWLISANVFEADGITFVRSYGPFSAPNGGEGFCAIDTGKGGLEQGVQQLSIYGDYYNFDDQMAGRRVEAHTYRERSITAQDVGKTVAFSFDARRGNINDPGDQGCINTTNPPCDSTADAFIQTIDPNAGFVTTNLVEDDTTDLPIFWDRHSIQLAIDAGLEGQLLRFGYSATASNFEASGVFYDNILVWAIDGGGTGGTGGVGGMTGANPVITNIAWATVGACTQGTASDYTITITATDADNDPTDLMYIGDVPGCLGAIDGAVSTITCPNVAPFPGTVVAEDPGGNTSLPARFTIGVCETSDCETNPGACEL